MSYCNKIWESPDKIIKKNIINEGVFGSKPTEYSTCTIEITNINSTKNSEYLADNITYPLEITIGESNTIIDRQIEKCITMMHQNELSSVAITLPDLPEINFNIKLINFMHNGYIYEWLAEDKCNRAQKHKEKGIELFRENRFQDASHRFSRALKLILSIPIPVDESPKHIDGYEVEKIHKLESNLYNNLASCYSKEKLYEPVVGLCTKVLDIDEDDVKALYKRGCAYFELKEVDKSLEDLMKLLSLDSDNKAAKEKLKHVNMYVSQEEAKFNSIVKNMFRT